MAKRTTERPWAKQFPKAYLSTREYRGRFVHYYSRKNGTPEILLPGKPGDADFAAAYRAIDLTTTSWVKAVGRFTKKLGM